MHTTGQAFVMSFQAGGPHAQDRALEAIAYAWDEMRRVPAKAYWEKPQGKNEPLKMEKHYAIVPRGIGLVIGCNTFPTWNGYPGHVREPGHRQRGDRQAASERDPAAGDQRAIAREVLSEAGFDPNVVTLVAHAAGDDTAQKLALRPEVKLIDFTGSSANGELAGDATRARRRCTPKRRASIRSSSTRRTTSKASARNIAFSLALYTGQMCTAPQNIYVPRGGIDTGEGHLSFDQVAQALAEAVQKLVGDPARAVEILGAVVNDGVAAAHRRRARAGHRRARQPGDRASAVPAARASARR